MTGTLPSPESGNPELFGDSTLGVLGLGLLGGALAQRALKAGLTVSGYDPDPTCRARFSEAGGQAAGSARAVARSSRRILLVLPHDGVTRDVLDEIADGLAPGTLVLDATTGDPAATEAFAQGLATRGVTYLDTTVSGSSEQARRGEALLMIGGPVAAFESCRDLLTILAERAIHTGPTGSAAKFKLVTNLVLGLNRAALAEGLVFAGTLGLDPAKTLETLRSSAAASRIMDSKGEKMLRADFAPQARLSQHLKDVRLMLESAAHAGQRLPLSEAHRELLEQAERLGLGALDNSAVIRAIEAAKEPSAPA